jgi:hypothetical protein
MKLKKLLFFLKRWDLLKIYTCHLIVVDATPKTGTKSQVRTIYLKTTNVIFLYLNGKKVKINTIYKIAPLEDYNHITVKVRGLFNSKTKNIPVPANQINTIQHPFSKTEKLISQPKIKKKAALENSQKISLTKNILLGHQDMSTISLKKVFKLKSTNQTLKTFNIN